MMQHKELKGQKLKYRPLQEAELRVEERDAAYEAHFSAIDVRDRKAIMIAKARMDRQEKDVAPRWVVATCKTGMEKHVAEAFQQQVIECWLPTERRKRPPLRGKKAVEIEVPIFRGYVFARVIPDDLAYAGLMAAAKINGLMASGGRVYLMPDRLMETLMLKSKKRERKQIDEKELPIYRAAINGKAVIRSGPFADFMVTVRRVLEKSGELVVELPIFGAMTEMTVDVDSIRL
ncbi:MAG TPA: transcription termination/antitermination NusG family protein [Ensifer sp.]|nr:transcription termination/antitermination NusG family protein [Ensifer sp.]